MPTDPSTATTVHETTCAINASGHCDPCTCGVASTTESLAPLLGVSDRLTFEGKLSARWFGDDVEILVGEDEITDALLRYEGWTVKVELIAVKETR